VFLDRDGVLIEDTGYPDDPQAIALLPGVGEGLRRLREAGWRLVVVSNQSGVARGKFTLERLAEVHERLRALLRAEGVELDGLYFCPHHPEGSERAFALSCNHRKPAAGMLLTAARDLGLDLRRSWMVGDKPLDLEAGARAGCRGILVGDGRYGGEPTARDLIEVAEVIAREAGRE
jgi:D-glycero-D-manno-heptose 1,7-bisphosphate phosphatase